MDSNRRMKIVSGLIVGGASFIGGYLLTWIFAGTKVGSLANLGPFSDVVPEWKATLWLFYDSHFVGTRTPEVFGPGGSLWGGGELIDTVGLLDFEVLYVVPPIVLVIGGAAIAIYFEAQSGLEAFRAGIRLTIGYLLAAFLALFFASHGGVGPSPIRALMIAGIVYPITFGGIGGTAGWIYRQKSGPETDESNR